MPTWNFEGQIVVITGGTGGLGVPLCAAFLEAGAVVYASGYSVAGEPVQAREDDRLHVDSIDVRSVKQVQGWIRAIGEREGRIDVLVNAAGICSSAKAPDIAESLWDNMIDVNLKGTFFASQAAAEMMKARGYGRIVNVGSIGAQTGGAIAAPPYCAAKAGIMALTKSFAQLYSPHGICVNTVSPGPFDTGMIADFPVETMARIVAATPNRRVGKPEDIVQSILFLADSSSLHITGSTLDVNGGLYMR